MQVWSPGLQPGGRRWLGGAAALLAALSLLLPVAPARAQEEPAVTPARVAGPDRFSTAAEIALLTFDISEAAIIASGEDFPDALAASYGPLGTDSPILLSLQREVPQVTLDALEQLEVGTVYLIGGEGALHADVEAQLRAAGYDELFRVGGADRFETAALMIEGPQAPEIGTLEGDRTALLASGEDFPDALSAGPIAAGANFPLLLTPTDAPHPRTDEVLAANDIERIVVIGGRAAVSSAVVQHYQDAGYEVERWAGPNRMATATTVADNAVTRLGFSPELVLLARGDSYPDALAAGVHGGMLDAPLLLSATPSVLSGDTRSWLEATCPDITAVRAIGGTGAVSQDVLSEAVAAAEACFDLPTAIEVGEEQIIDQDGNVLLTIGELPDNVAVEPGIEFGGPTRFTDAVLSDDGAWIAIGSTGVVHGYGWLYDVAAAEHDAVAFQYGGSVESHSWSPDDRFALFSIGTPAATDLLKIVDRGNLQAYPAETGFVVRVDEEEGMEPPFANEFDRWEPPHTLCFAFEGTLHCIDAATGETRPSTRR